MTDVEKWLAEHRPDCINLSVELKEAIAHFVLVWSKFEAVVIGAAHTRLFTKAAEAGAPFEAGNYEFIEDAAKNGINDVSKHPTFVAAYEFQKGRYYNGVQFSDHLDHLVQENSKYNSMIKEVFENATALPASKLFASLLVAYCLRTNLIHGQKWSSGFDDQVENFQHATQVLILATESIRETQI